MSQNRLELKKGENYSVTWKLTLQVEHETPTAYLIVNFWRLFTEAELVASELDTTQVSRWQRLGRSRCRLAVTAWQMDANSQPAAITFDEIAALPADQRPIDVIEDEIHFNGGFLEIASPVRAMIDAIAAMTGWAYHEPSAEHAQIPTDEEIAKATFLAPDGNCFEIELAAVPVHRGGTVEASTIEEVLPTRSRVNRNIYFEAEVNPTFSNIGDAPIFYLMQSPDAAFIVIEQSSDEQRKIYFEISNDEYTTVTFILDQLENVDATACQADQFHDIIINQDSDQWPDATTPYYFEAFIDTLPLKFDGAENGANRQPAGTHHFSQTEAVRIGYAPNHPLFKGAIRRIIFDPSASSGGVVGK